MRTAKFPVSLLLCVFLFSFFTVYASAQLPSLPHTIRGSVYIDGSPAPLGTMITAKIGDETVSEFNITNQGLYAIGIETSVANQGEVVKLYVNGIDANASVVLKSGEIETVDLSVVPPSADDIWLWLIAALLIVVIIIIIVKYRRK